MSFAKHFMNECNHVSNNINFDQLDDMIEILVQIRETGGRLFFLGVGGSAANCSHAVNDFRKIAGIECYAPTDNVSELTARTNDEGWETIFHSYLKTSKLSPNDGVFIFSVGGGDAERNVSANLIEAIKLAKQVSAKTMAIVGRPDGYAAKNCDASVILNIQDNELVTPIAEAYQGVIWHLLVSHPKIKIAQTKWESLVASQ